MLVPGRANGVETKTSESGESEHAVARREKLIFKNASLTASRHNSVQKLSAGNGFNMLSVLAVQVTFMFFVHRQRSRLEFEAL